MIIDKKLSKDEMQILRDISIHSIIGVQNRGRRITVKCPFHNGTRQGSFFIYPDNSYHCFGCNKNGKGAIDFLKDMSYSFQEVLQILSDMI